MDRAFVVSKGSAGGHAEFKVPGFPAARATKAYDASTLDCSLAEALRQNPVCTSVRAMHKPNDLKPRALYVVDARTTELEGIFITPLERRIQAAKFPVLSATESEARSVVRNAVCDQLFISCYDFEDFNSQHTLESLRAVVNGTYDYIAD